MLIVTKRNNTIQSNPMKLMRDLKEKRPKYFFYVISSFILAMKKADKEYYSCSYVLSLL